MFGDIVKVTPTSKVVGDMALFLVANNLTPEDTLDPERELAFPESVVEFFRGAAGPASRRLSPRAPRPGAEGPSRAHRPARRQPAAGRPGRSSREGLGPAGPPRQRRAMR